MKNYIKYLFRTLIIFVIISAARSAEVLAVNMPANGGKSQGGDALNLSVSYINGYLKAFGGIVIFIAVALVGIRMVIIHNRPDDRANSMTALLHIALGAFIIGTALLISGFIIGTQDKMLGSFTKEAQTVDQGKSVEIADDSNFMSRALSVPINAIIDTVMGTGDKDGIQKLMGFKAIDKLIFNDGSVTGTEPFSDKEWASLDYLYAMFIGITSPFILIMVAKTGFSAIKNANSVSKRVGLKDDVGRWIFSIFLIASAPLFFRGMVYFFNMMTSAIYDNIIIPTSLSGNSLSVDATSIQKIKTGNVFSTAIVKVIFCYLDVKINMIFLARKIMLSVMYVFTPIAACLWGINRNVNAASMWFGEVLTNAAMAFFYGITYTVMCVMINATGATGWFFTMMWMFSMMKISEVLRNSLQGLFARLSGINEEDMGKGAAGVVKGAFRAAKKTTKAVARAGGNMAINGYAGAGATANSNGNTNYSMMNGQSIEKHNGQSSDPARLSQKKNAGSSQGNGKSQMGESEHSENTNSSSSSGNLGNSTSEGLSRSGADTEANGEKHSNSQGKNKASGIKSSLEQLSNNNAVHSKYSDMLCSNYDNEILKKGQKSSSMGTGGNKLLNGIETINRIGNAKVRKNAAANAISSTVNRMVSDSKNPNSNLYKLNNRPINDKEAAKLLFGNDKTEKNKKGFIRNARINNTNRAKQILASTNPYINADTNFKWSQE